MKILAFEFSSSRRSVAAVLHEGGSGCRVLGESVEAVARHTPAFRLADEVILKAGWARSDVDCLTVCLGPGSYTGIRMSLAIAQGWQLIQGGKVCGIDAPSCLAEQLWRKGERGVVTLAIDAMRGEFYSADFHLENSSWRPLNALSLVTKAELESKMAAGGRVFGPDLEKVLPEAKPLYVEAGIVAELAIKRGDFRSAHELEPVYLREVSFVKSPPLRRPADSAGV